MRSAALACVALLVALPALAQSFGANVGGAVTDETGALLPGAAITIIHASNGRKVVVTTGERGDYRVVALQPGDYDLSVERSGFAPDTRRVTLLVGARRDDGLRAPGCGR
jgi:carboxypeptidase family protein